MKSPIPVAMLVMVILLLSSSEEARAARPSRDRSSSKKAMITQFVESSRDLLSEKKIRGAAEGFAQSVIQGDPRIPSDKKNVETAQALAASVDIAIIRFKVAEFLDKSFTEPELKAIQVFVRSSAGQKFMSLDINKIVEESYTVMVAANYQQILGVPFKVFDPQASPSPTPSPSPVAETSPSPTPSPSVVTKPSPRVSEVEASWLTKTIWKWFPETNKCDVAR